MQCLSAVADKVVLAVAIIVVAAPSIVSAQGNAASIPEASADAIREHVDEAEDVLNSLLEWRHVTTAARTRDDDRPLPTAPATTMISVQRSDVQRLSELLSAAAQMLPGRATADRPRGDLRAHIQKAQEIARELMPQDAARPVGTTGAGGNLIEVDRTALSRLEIEIDAIELVAPRRLKER